MSASPEQIYEQALVVRSQLGDEAAFSELLKLHGPRLFHFTHRMMQSAPDQVADVTQEIWVAIFRALPGLQDATKFRPWAFRIARDRIYREYRRRKLPVRPLDETDLAALPEGGDGSGAVLAFRFECPSHIAYGAVADRYVTLDFTGRRQFTLVETESFRWSDYQWNDNKQLYHMYRETVNFGAIDSFSVWLQNLPAGHETKVLLSPIRALPLRATEVTNPKITVSGKTIEFAVKLAAGSWIEANGPGDCAVYGSKGEALGKITPIGDWPMLGAGASELQFSCEPGDGAQPRARVVTIANGEEL